MTNHKWMIDVLEDLETYAASNELNSLQCLLSEARSKAEIETHSATHKKSRRQRTLSVGRLN